MGTHLMGLGWVVIVDTPRWHATVNEDQAWQSIFASYQGYYSMKWCVFFFVWQCYFLFSDFNKFLEARDTLIL